MPSDVTVRPLNPALDSKVESLNQALGAGDWIKALEATSGRVLTTPPRGRPPLKGGAHAFPRK
jgi:hypothetical protein